MKTDVFPSNYNQIIDKSTYDTINEAQSKHNSRVNAINCSRPLAPGKHGDTWSGLACFGGFVACSCICVNTGSVGIGIATFVGIFVMALMIGSMADESLEKTYQDNQRNIDSRINAEKKNIEIEIQEIKNYAQKEKDKYLIEFENNAQNLSVQFAESELAKEVIEWMTDGFCRTIDAADRRSHIEKIIVPFVFHVFNNKITCNLGTFDFELKRCRNLNSPLEQTALARAIVSSIQLAVIMRYPKDASGTDISIDISYSYSSEDVSTTIKYIAPNGNYKDVRSW